MTCPAASDCWVVGYAASGLGGTLQTLTEHWNGRRWAIVTLPTTIRLLNLLAGVTCVTGRDCWAVGFKAADDGSGTYQTLIEHYPRRR